MGLFSKKENKNVIKKDENNKVTDFELEDIFLIPVSEIPARSKRDIALSIEKSRKIVQEKNYKAGPVLYYNEKTERVEARYVQLLLPIKLEGESVVWYRKKEDGLINKTLQEYEVLTNYRGFVYNFKIERGAFFPILDESSVVITNQKRISESQRTGSFAGVGARGIFVGTTGGFSTGESETFGDVNILFEGEILYTYNTVQDPSGLANLIKYQIKRLKGLVEKLGQQDEQREKLENKGIKCTKCQTDNPSDSQFCNKCGHKFTTVCTQCKNVNPSDSEFCNKCGFALQ